MGMNWCGFPASGVASCAMKHTNKAYLHSDLTDISIGSFYRAYNKLGFGFLESVYRNALARELAKAGVAFEREVPIDVWYDGEKIGHFKADFVVESRVILEVKASQAIGEADQKQLLNYLLASKIEVGLLIHFGHKPSVKRTIQTNDRKGLIKRSDQSVLTEHAEGAVKGQ
jgi:GxxExxY protein